MQKLISPLNFVNFNLQFQKPTLIMILDDVQNKIKCLNIEIREKVDRKMMGFSQIDDNF